MKITFWGATDEVTGSKTFTELPDGIIMIDCGLVQGSIDAEKKNLERLPFPPREIKGIILTHAHLDHSGFLPRMVKQGFIGSIFCTPATSKLTRIILLDSAGLLEEDFYTEQDVQMTLSMIKVVDLDTDVETLGGSFKFQSAGHILGASSVILNGNGKKVIFSGDLGRHDDPLMPPPNQSPEVDLVIMESTYGGKKRSGDYKSELSHFLKKISHESRVGIIASFAVARAQMLLTLIYEYYLEHPEDKVRVIIDSPMMREACRVYKQYSRQTNKKDLLYLAMEKIEVLEHEREWESLKRKTGPLIILSSSGMLTGGRIKRHLENWQDDNDAILFLPGYQGEGTPGRSFLEGSRDIKINENESLHWSGEVWGSEAFSSHADQSELTSWLDLVKKTTPIYLLHGEPQSKKDLQGHLLASQFQKVKIPMKGDSFIL